MKTIRIADTTLCREDVPFRFKEKIELIRQLARLQIDAIELGEIKNARTDILLVRTASAFVQNSTLSVAAGSSMQSIADAAAALSNAKKGCIRIELPVSVVGMEYGYHKKPAKMLEWITQTVTAAKQTGKAVEFCAVDATRAEPDFLPAALQAAVEAGAGQVTLCDSAAEWMPDDFAAFVKETAERCGVPVAVKCENKNGLATASAILAVRAGADGVKVCAGGTVTPLEPFATMLHNCGERYAWQSSLKYTELHRILRQISWVTNTVAGETGNGTLSLLREETVQLYANDTQETVMAAVAKLGYDLSEDDQVRVYEEFLRAAAKKNVGEKELDAIVASVALQVPATYQLVHYVVNNGDVLPSSAQLALQKDGKLLRGICMGDGPIDAAFLAVEQIIGHRYELDDFQIQAVTEGKEAMGSALVKLRAGGKVYSGNGISTDIIGASLRAYLSAVNKIVYEEGNSL